MTYSGFLLRFLVVPLVLLTVLTIGDARREPAGRGIWNAKAVRRAISLLAILAVAYTTPWDNYLVATGVWYYDPRLISGVLLGWVPLEEYAFFILETILAGLSWGFLARRVRLPENFRSRRQARILSSGILVAIWLLAAAALALGGRPATYSALILAWAIPVILLQTAFGADILWHYRGIVLMAILMVSGYLSAADALAISSGTWTIHPAQSLGVFLGPLPVEEAIFFLATTTIVIFGMTLALAPEGQSRWRCWAGRHLRIIPQRKPAGDAPKPPGLLAGRVTRQR